MATPARLRLKAQIAARSEIMANDLPYARVWVDTGVFHLDNIYDYMVPQRFSSQVQLGVRVEVSFNSRLVEAIVLERVNDSVVSHSIKPITKILSSHPVATPTSLALIAAVATRWGTNPYDIVRSAIPPRVATVDKVIPPQSEISIARGWRPLNYSFVALKPYQSSAETVLSLVAKELLNGSVLLLAPDERDIDGIIASAVSQSIPFLRLDSSISRSERYQNYLLAMNAQKTLVIGARSAVFTPMRDLTTIIVHKESSYEHFEIRSPGWNVREVVQLRRSFEEISVVFTGYVPSLEISVLIENKKLKYDNVQTRVDVKAFSSNDGSLLPGRIFSEIRKALKSGGVLFLLPRKGYGNALLCAHCKNIATCTCGARLIVPGKKATPQCSICEKIYTDWRCSWCDRDKQYLAARGIERAAEEISRAFPGTPMILSFGDVIKNEVETGSVIVLATAGSIPFVQGGYAAVVVLEGLKFFAHPDLRAQERARELFFECAAFLQPQGSLLLSIEEGHPIVAALTRWSPGALLRKELAERHEIPLPPFVTSYVISGASSEFSNLIAGIKKAITENRLPADVKLFGPIDIGKANSKITMYCAEHNGAILRSFLHELQRRRSIAKRESLTLRINPYSL